MTTSMVVEAAKLARTTAESSTRATVWEPGHGPVLPAHRLPVHNTADHAARCGNGSVGCMAEPSVQHRAPVTSAAAAH